MPGIEMRRAANAERGFSLVELMISMVLGLLIVGGAITVFVSNRQAFVATENLSRMQETGRIAFELLARDLREAGSGPCQNDRPVRNLVNSPASRWWTNWDANSASSVIGYADNVPFGDIAFGTGAGVRLTGTDAVEIKGVSSMSVSVDAQGPNANVLTETTSPLTVNTSDHGLAAGDLAMVCNFDGSAIFQVTGVSGTSIQHAASGTPGNSTAHLSTVPTRAVTTNPATEGQAVKVTCRDQEITVPSGVPRCGGAWVASLARVTASRWFVANNGRTGSDGQPLRSLYRASVVRGVVENIEVAENVSDMEISYLMRNGANYLGASAAGMDFAQVTAMRVSFTIESPDAIASDGGRLTRRLHQTITLRNRLQ